jgi:hypothetical protein
LVAASTDPFDEDDLCSPRDDDGSWATALDPRLRGVGLRQAIPAKRTQHTLDQNVGPSENE